MFCVQNIAQNRSYSISGILNKISIHKSADIKIRLHITFPPTLKFNAVWQAFINYFIVED